MGVCMCIYSYSWPDENSVENKEEKIYFLQTCVSVHAWEWDGDNMYVFHLMFQSYKLYFSTFIWEFPNIMPVCDCVCPCICVHICLSVHTNKLLYENSSLICFIFFSFIFAHHLRRETSWPYRTAWDTQNYLSEYSIITIIIIITVYLDHRSKFQN